MSSARKNVSVCIFRMKFVDVFAEVGLIILLAILSYCSLFQYAVRSDYIIPLKSL